MQRQTQQHQEQQIVQQQRQVVQQQQQQQQQQFSQQQISQQRISRTEQHVTRQVTQQQQVQGMVVQGTIPFMPPDAQPPVFEQIFKNARFAQGGNAHFQGKLRGNPKPQVSWTRKGAPLFESAKYKMQYEQQTGNVSLLIMNIGPGDEGEYTCTARNQYGEAICSVFISPEGMAVPQGQQGFQQQQQTLQQQRTTRTEKFSYTNGTNGHMIVEEDFKVDTFEYRLIREVSFRETVTRRYANEVDAQMSTTIDRSLGPPSAPQIAQKPRNSKLQEGSDAVFTIKIAANPKPRLTWFKNGQRLVSSSKHQTSYSNQQATLKISHTDATDTGHYTLLAENPQGVVVSSAYLAVEPTSVQDFIEQRETTQKMSQYESTEAVDSTKMLAPNFVRVCNDRDVTEGKMTRFDCRVTGRPYPEVAWIINGRQVADDATHKILVNESGNHALMITNVSRFDHGVVQCVARNKAGETSFQCNLNVIEKEQVVAPKFVERFSTVTVKEGEPVSLSVRAVGTPIPRISWQKDGVAIMPSVDVRVSVDGGASVLDLAAARATDSGWYQCTAQNVAGSTATRARLYVQTPQQPEYQGDRRLHLPRPTKVIEPEPQPGPEIIYLRHVERAKPRPPAPEEDRQYPPPQFIIPLSPASAVEGGRIHLEARIEPVGDPSMRVEWFHNGRPLAASSRVTTTFKFGFIALDMLSIVQMDAGEFICRVTSNSGSTESRATLTVTVRASIEQTSQHPESLQYISNLEDYSRYQRTESTEEFQAQKPAFIRPLHDLGQLNEGRNAHFEAQLTPVSDPTMKVEWYKDGKPITASSRITSIFNFGYVSLNIMHLRAEDSGSYAVRAVNRWGEAVSTSTLTVIARSSVTGDLGIPEQQRYIEQVEQLEAYQTAQHHRQVVEPPESTAPPVFKTPIKDQLNIREGGFAHFEARLEPVGDSTLRVEWLKDGRPVEASSRITTFFNFGYVALTIKYVTIHDVGIYTCRAYNTLGQVETTAQMSVITKQDIVFDSQHPSGLQKIQHLEDSSRYSRTTQEEVQVTQKPRFLGPLKGTNKIVEGQRAHFEARVEPQSDISMQIEWYFNGKVIMTASRIQTYHDFGYVALDILSVRAEDAGTYTVVARNALGEAQLSASMVVETRASIDTSSMHRGTYEKTQKMETGKFVEPQYDIEEISKSKPIFVTPLNDPKPVSEGKNIHLECRLEPMGDPTMRVEWFQNGRSITVGSRFRTYYDFGFVALDIIHATSMDTGEYTVRATNHLGSAHTSAQVRVISRSDILTETQNEAALEQIQLLEDMSRHRRTVGEEEVMMAPPTFTRPLHNIETIEGTNIHLECRLQPVGDSTMRVDWFVNGRPVKTGHRFRPAYDFDYVALDLLSVYPEDSGVYTCQARNALGEAVTSCSVKIHAKKDLVLESQHPGGLEKIQYLEDASRYRRTEQVDEIITVKPRFVTKPKSLGNMREGQHAHFECKLEPVTDSNLKVEWYKNGRPITVGHRFRPIHDFGYVALDIVDLIAEDSGTYTCRAVNLVGMDETTCSLQCRSTQQILTGTENQTGLEQIQYLEDRSRYQRHETIEETTTQAPTFTSSLKQVNIKESQRAHFECRLIPVSDATMKVEWFHNNVPLKSGSRFTETNNFGFVALDILHCLPEDSGTYTCRAKNIIGEAVTSANLNVQSKKSIYLDSQHEGALQRLYQLEDSSRHQRRDAADDTVSQAPVFTQPMRDLRTAENQAAHFEARLIPVGDARLKVEWLRNGVPIQASNRVTTMHDFGYVALNMKYVYPEDSGTYTCRAVNDLGEAVTSATLVVQSKESLMLESQHQQALQKIQMLEDSSRYQRREEEDVIVTQAPKFTVQLNGPSELVEAQSAHYECRIEPYPDPNLKVEWFFNGQPLQTGHRFRTTYDFGFAALDVLTVYGEDSGEYTCRATNKLGQAQSSIKLNVKSKSSIIRDTQHEGALQKIQYLEDESRYKRTAAEEVAVAEKPQFGRPLKNIEHLPEGRMAHLEATLTPVNDPTMKVEWFCNGRPVPQGHRFKTTYDFGFVALDILYAYPEDSGTYMCKARNAVGEAVTTCSVTIDTKSGLQLDTLDEQRLQKIRDLENYQRPEKVELEPVGQKPVFITPLNSLTALKEGDHAHLECRVEPINDPHMKIEWFVNGVAIRTGHRFRTTHDFGYVALDVLYTWGEDTGTYMCKASNLLGEAINTTTINVQSRRSVYLDTQHPEGLEKIRELEAQGHTARLEVEEPIPTPPKFVTELRGTTEVMEGATAHFECQVEPLHDSNLRIEFYHNGKPLPSASRFHITFDFGYVALDIGHCVPEDAGEYSVKAINKLGQCTSSINLKVIAKGSIISDSQRPEGLEKIRQLESAQPFQRPEVPEAATRQRPVFTQPLQNIDSIPEGTTAHFECRLIPVGDPTLKVEWFRNEKPLETSSRITKTHDFGFVSMDLTHVRAEDEGVYMCRASNALGEAVTTASMKIKTKADIQLDTLHQEGMRKIQQLESRAPTREEEPERTFEKPIFTQLLTGPSELWEGQNAHFEARVVPVGDPTLRYEWYVNGVELKMGSRFRTTHDFGFVTLDIMTTVQEDSGVYMCKAINRAGEAVSSTSLKVKPKGGIMGEPLQPDAWQKIQLKEAELNKVPPMFVDMTPQQAPVFTTHLQSMDKLQEGQHVYLEAQVEPRTDPNLRIEWFKNGTSLTTGARLRSTFDFGLVTLSINSLRADDSAIYTCKATNLLGEAVSTCTLKIEDKHWLLGKPLHPEALPLIESLEAPKQKPTEGPEPTYESPVFISHLNNVECKESDNVHFECHVEPSKDPTMNIEWFVNGKPLPTGSRYKSTYDFGYVSLDINHAYSEDSGVYMCKATNSKGQASTSGTLRCHGDKDIYFDTQHPQGRAGLEKVQEVEDAVAGKYQRQPSAPDAQFPAPVWTVPLSPEFHLGEAQPLHLEANVEPKNDPKLKIEWFFNGKALEHGSRFKMTSDFGFVTLDLTEVYERDQGIYTCKASNQAGEAFTSTTIYCSSKTGLIEQTQHPKGEEGLEKIQTLEESLRRQEAGLPESDLGQPPVFTSQFEKLTNLSEGEIAHFEASLSPVGDQTMVVEWFYNGKTLEASHRTRTVHAFGMVVLEILGTKIEDSGTYTCKATNKWGQAEISVELECVDKSKGQKPQFTTHIQSVEGLKDGDSAHFECTLIPVGDPNMKVEWFHNGKPLRHSTRIKSVSDFGFVVLDIAYTQSHDSGEYVCKASNKYGEDYTKATVRCVGKGGVYLDTLQPDSLARIRELELGAAPSQIPTSPVLEPPKFITQIKEVVNLKEGQSAHFEARLTPVHDPDLVVEWYFNGKKLPHGHRYRTFHDFGIVILDILYCYEENSGEYECRAVNKVGQDSTKASLKCSSKASLILESQLPQGMEGGLEKIQTLEDSLVRQRDEKSLEERGQAPVFTVPLANIDSLREGESAHFEGRLTPTNDPRLKVEWFWNGKPLKTGSRFRTFCDFGFVILEISPVYPEDSGEYSCRAFNEYGEAVTTASMKVQGKRSIILESQLPKGMESTIDKIAELEGLGHAPSDLSPEADSGKPPEFITTPADLTLAENQLAHFECRLTPVNDPSMRVEWYHNGKPLWAGSRVKTINDFGFVILEIAGCYIRESGLYTCKATNKHGEASVSCKLQVHGRQGIIMEPQLPSNFRSGTESLQKLEENLYKREEIQPDAEEAKPPKFIVELKEVEATEAGPAHFDCRVEPVGDSSMRIDWFFNGRPFATGSRVHMLNDFGFIVLDMDYVYARDSGEYMCRATNKWGTATTKTTLTVKVKQNIVLDSQLPKGMSGEKLKELERGHIPDEKPEEKLPAEPPRFITQIESVGVGEAEPVHFECRVEPKKDPKLRIEWYRNGKLLPTGHRYRSLFDLGYVSLDILYVYPEDSGDYICKAINDYGEDITKATISCKKIPQIILQSQVPKGMKRSEALMQMEATIKKYTSEVHLTEDDLYEPEKKQPPRFVTQILDQTNLVEMQTTKFECQLAPVGDPNMKVEWFLNGKPLPYKNRFTPIYDFGYVAMNFGWVYPEDSGEYLCRATNLYGMDETRATIKTTGKPGIIYDSQLPQGMKSIERIRELEAIVIPDEVEEGEKQKEKPLFVTKPEPYTTAEGEPARFCCRVTGYPRPRVMWLINGHTVVNGMRYRLTYDGMWHLDIPKTRQYDHGKVEVVARNSSGETRVETTLTVKARGDDYRGVLKNSPRRILGTKEYRKPEWVTHMEEMKSQLQAAQSAPTFIQEITDVRAQETETAKFEAVFAGTPTPDIIWYHNEKIIRNTKNIKVTIKENRTIVTIKKVTEEDAGTYTCKATSEAGLAVTKATLHFTGLTAEQRQVIEIKTAHEEMEKIRLDQQKIMKRKVQQKRAEPVKPEKEPVQQQEQQPLESTTQFVETSESAKAVVKFDVQESVEVSAVAASKKVPDDVTYTEEKIKEVAKVVTTPQESVTVTETQPQAIVQEITEKKVTKKKAKKTEVKEIVPAKEVEEVLQFINMAEFGPAESPLRELATVGLLLRHGMTVDEVVAQYSADQFPTLRTAPAQSAMVTLVEREGHSALISETLTSESTTEQTLVGVFRAFLRMIELRHTTIEEVLTLFSPQDFQTHSWETHTSQVVTEESSVTHSATITQVQTQEVKTQVTRKTTEVIREEDQEDKEDIFKSPQLPETRKATLYLTGQEVAEHEEIVELIQEGTLTRESPIKETALMKQDTIQLPVASEQVPTELEGHFDAPLKPAEKTAELSFVEGHIESTKPSKPTTMVQPSTIELPLEEAPVLTTDVPEEQVVNVKDIPETVSEATITKQEVHEAPKKPSKKKKVSPVKKEEEQPDVKIEEDEIKEESTLEKKKPKKSKHVEEEIPVSITEDDVKPKIPEKVKLKKEKLEIKEVKPQKLKIEDKKDNTPLFAAVKLKKASVPEKKEVKPAAQLPKVLLKSRITRIPYPPEVHHLEITDINAVIDNGILSRNYEEAMKIKKKKIKKIKLPQLEKPELEEYVPFIMEKEEVPQTQPTISEPIKQKPEISEEKPVEPALLKIGKGKIPQEEETVENVRLRKVPPKEEKEDEVLVKHPRKEEPKQEAPKCDDQDVITEMPQLKPFDSEIPLDAEDDKQTPEEKKPEEIIPETKVKRKKKTSEKPEVVPEEKKLVLGKPKDKPSEKEDDISLKYKQKDLPKPEPEEIKLKPFTKEESPEPEAKKEIPAPEALYPKEEKPEEEIKPKDIETKDKLKKKTKKKKPADLPTEEVFAEDTVQKKEKPLELKVAEEEPEMISIKTPKKELTTADEAVVLIKPKSVKEEQLVDESVVLTVEKQPTEETVEEQIVVKRKKSVKPKTEDVSEEVTISNIKPSVKDEVVEETTVIKKKPKPQIVEEVSDEITVIRQEEIPVEKIKEEITENISLKKKKPVHEEVSEEVIISKKKPSITPQEDVSEEVVIKKKTPKKPVVVEEVNEEMTIKKKETIYSTGEESVAEEFVIRKEKASIKNTEDISEEFVIKPKKPSIIPQVTEDVEEELVVKKKKTPKAPTFEEAAEEFTITKEVPIPIEKPVVEDTERMVVILKKPDKPTEETEQVTITPRRRSSVRKPSIEEHPEEKITIKQRRPSEDVVVEEVVTDVTFKPKVTKPKEEIEQEFKISLQTYEEEDISMSGKVRLPRKKKIQPTTDEASAEMTIQKEVEVDQSQDFNIPLHRKSSVSAYNIEDIEQEFQVGLRQKQHRASIVCEEESLDIKVKRKPSKPSIPVFSQESAGLTITKEEEVTVEKGEKIIETTEGDVLFSICSYVAENPEALNLVEGERLYIIDNTSQDWWFVQKHLTQEKGWVPAVYLRDEPSYTLYVQKKLHEKIDKLPIFEKPSGGEEVYAPRFVEKLQPKHVPDGATVQFECQVEGSPRPQITWFRQTAIIKPSQDFQIFYDDDNVATLIIREVFPEDAGTFTCVAKNAAGFASSTTELSVEAPLSDHGSDITSGLSRKSLSRESSLADILEGIPPTFSRKPKAKIVKEGSDVVLECRLVAVPEPEVTWFYRGEPVKSSDTVSVTTQSDMHMYSTMVSISKVTKGQEGVYQVVAKNREGQATLDIILKVKTGEPEPPQVVEPLQDVTISEGESAILATQITGKPTPKVVWSKDGKPDASLPIQSKGETYSLTLIKPSASDTARYSVTATNKLGSATTSCQLTVEAVPGPQAPLFVERFEEQNVKEKGTIRLVAKVTGNPVPMVTWFRNNKTLLASPKQTQLFDGENIVLEIRDADSEEDAGDYKCVASNSLGTATHGARVTVDVEKVSFTKQLQERVELNETETVTLECETSHTVSTKWQHNGVDLSGMDHRELVQEGRSHRLIIKRATLHDAGTYTCSVKGQTTTCEVTVRGMKPDFVRKLEDFEVKEQEVAILEVEVTSETADVVWKKDGLPVEPIPGKLEVEKKGNVRKLLIRSSSVHDEGEYTCAIGDQECAAEVTVIELPPQILTKMQDVTVTKGEKAILEVELTKGDALVRWFKDDKELHFSEHVQLSIDGKKQKLKIYQAEPSDAGLYSCRVGDQPDQVSTASVTVEEPLVEFITRLPDVTTVPINTDAVFTVELSRPADVKWLKKGKEIKPSNKYMIEVDGAVHKLTIKKVTTEDQTEITCTAFNVKTSSKLKVEKIEIAPRIKESPKEYKVKKGDDVTIEVKFTASPPPTDEWTVNGTVIKKSKRVDYTISEESASLTIKKVEESDVGSYTLRLKNTIGEASAEMTLIIMQVPGEPGTPDILEVTDDSVTLHWKAPDKDGNSPITRYIMEFHDKEEFMEWHEVEETITTTTHKVTKLTHDVEIMFRVSAENEVGRGPKSPSTRYVRVSTPVAAEPPVIQEPLKDTTVGLGQNITLECVVGGTPLPEIKWYRNGKPIPKSKKMTYENRVATYTMEKATESHAGTYACKASNSAGTAETTCKLLVQDVPKVEVPEAVQDQRLTLATQWKPEVSFSGFPRPDITWEKDGEPIVSDKRIKIFIDETTTTIAIYSVERADTGRYTVRASNVAGEAKADLTLRVVEKPGRPEGPITFSNITADSITVEWNPPLDNGGIELTKYVLEKCEASKQSWTKAADVDGRMTSHTVQKLIENNEYMFRVFAVNSIGTSEPLTSEPVVVRTYFNKPSPPRGPLEPSGMTNTSCTITWNPPEDDGGTPVLDYTVQRKEAAKRVWETLGTVVETSLSMTDLVLNMAYTFKITARNKEGDSEPYISEDPIVAGRKITPPSAPLNFNAIDITSKSVTLQWQPPASTGGTELTGYIIEKQYGTSKKWSKVVTLDPGHLQYCVENLKEKSELYFRIYAENMIGLSTPAATSVISLQTHATVPSPPTDPLEIRSLGPNSIIVEWGVPEYDGGAPLEGYKIAIRDVKKTMWMEVGQVSAEVQKLTIKDLQENHEYLVRIFARNEVGLSEPLESDEPFLVKKPTGVEEADVEERSLLEKDTPSLSFSTETTTSWMREAGMDADIHFYAKGSLLRRSEYFFRIWYYAKHLFK